jgi:hypothetical protein
MRRRKLLVHQLMCLRCKSSNSSFDKLLMNTVTMRSFANISKVNSKTEQQIKSLYEFPLLTPLLISEALHLPSSPWPSR